MRRLIFGGLAALVLAFGTIGQPPDTVAAEPDAGDPPNVGEDEPAMRILRQMAGYLQETNQLRVHLKMDMRIEAPGMKQEMGYDYTLKLDRPQRFALILNEGPFGVSVYCDGETLTSYLPMQKRYTVSPAPERLGELDESGTAGAMDLGMMMGGGEGLGQFLRGEGLVEEMTKDVEKAEYVGQEELNGVPCHHLKISEAEVDVDVWVEVGDRPLPHRIVPDLSGMYAQMYSELGEGFKEMKVTMAITFADWDVAVQFKEEDFKFTPPEGAEQADSLFDFGDFGGDEEGPHPLLGEPAPQFETTDLEGEPLALEDHLEQNIVVLDFWAEWCGPCREGLPIVSKVAAEFTDKGVTFYAVNLGDDEEAIRDFLKASELQLPVALDKDGAIGEMYQANAIPQTVLIGKDGRVQVVHVGLLPNLEDELRQNLNDLLAGKDLATATLEQAAKAAEEAEAEQPDPEPQGLAPVWSVEGSWTGVAVERGAPRAYAVDTKGELVTLDSAGKELQRHNRQQQSSVLRAGNLLGTEASELLAFDAWGDTLHAFTAEGTLLWQYALGQGIDDVWAADLTGDGLDEVIIGYNGSTGLHVLDNRGTLLWKDTSIGNVWHVSAGDFDGDGSREVVTTSAAGQLHVFSHDGQKLKDIEVPLYANMVRMTPVAREDKSGGIAIVGGSGDRGEQLLAVTYDGEQKWLVDLPDAGVDHIDSAATATSAGWVAVAMRGGLVHVVEIESGEIIAHVGRQGQTPQIAWLPREGEPPLLVVATGRELNAFRVSATDGEP